MSPAQARALLATLADHVGGEDEAPLQRGARVDRLLAALAQTAAVTKNHPLYGMVKRLTALRTPQRTTERTLDRAWKGRRQ